MASFRFMHAADLHLDSPFIGISGLDDTLRSYVQESTFRALERLVQLAIDQQVDFIVISGDIYDSSNISARALRFLDSLNRLGMKGIAVYVIHGNHDPLDSTKLSIALPPHVHVFGAEPASVTAVRRSDHQEVAVITGMSYPTSKVTDNIAIRYPAPSSRLYHIGLLHANVDGDPQHETYAPCTKRDLIQSDFITGRSGIFTPVEPCRNLLILCIRAISRDVMSGRRDPRDVISSMWMRAPTRN